MYKYRCLFRTGSIMMGSISDMLGWLFLQKMLSCTRTTKKRPLTLTLMKSLSPKNRSRRKKLWSSTSHSGPRGASSLRWVSAFSVCRGGSTELCKFGGNVLLHFSANSPVTLRSKTLLRRHSVSWTSQAHWEYELWHYWLGKLGFDNVPWDWCTMNSGNSSYSVSLLICFI